MAGAPEVNAAPNILLIRLKAMGDVLLTLPATYEVRENFPDAVITMLVSKEYEPLIEGFPAVDRVLALDRALYHRGNPKAILLETFRLLRQLRGGRFSLVVDFQGFGETAFLTWSTGAPARWGYLHYATRGWAYHRRIRPDHDLHPIERNLSLLRQCGLRAGPVHNDFILPAPALEEARRFCDGHRCDWRKPMLYLHPFTSTGHKNWPLENYLQLGRFWRGRGVQVVLGGSPADRPLLDQARAEGLHVAAGVPILVAAGLVKLSTLFVSGDTGFLHLAVALGKPVLMLSQVRRPGTAVPIGQPDCVILPSHGGFMRQIEVGRVIKSTESFLAEPEPT